jgi:hypothetical protein
MPARDEPRLLDNDLLAALERRWQDQGAFVGRALRPGLSDAEIDRATEPIQLRLPREARRWWGWHDGADPQPPGPAGEYGPGRAFLPLHQAVRHCVQWREVMGHEDGEGPDPNWKYAWLPIDSEKIVTVIDCSVKWDEPVPARRFFAEMPQAGAAGVRSLGELVETWIRLIDSGAWAYNRSEDHWEYHSDRVDPQTRTLGLA